MNGRGMKRETTEWNRNRGAISVGRVEWGREARAVYSVRGMGYGIWTQMNRIWLPFLCPSLACALLACTYHNHMRAPESLCFPCVEAEAGIRKAEGGRRAIAILGSVFVCTSMFDWDCD